VAIRDINSELVLEAVEKQIKKELVELNYSWEAENKRWFNRFKLEMSKM